MVARSARRAGAGFTYVSVMVLVAVIALAGAATLKLGSVLQRSRLEAELLAIGAEYADALQSYADATPAGQPTQPRSFKELLRDPRSSTLKRHLRRIYVDPLTGSAEWGIVYAGDKTGIVAIYSLSDAKAVKIGNFPERFRAFEGRTKVSDWKFTAAGKPAGTAQQQAANAGANQGTANPGTANPGTANPGTANPALQQPGSLFPATPATPPVPQQDGPAPEPAPPPDAPPPDAPQPEKPASQPDQPPQEPPDPARDVENAPPTAKPQQR
ncbi:type II secretion system protein [Oxalobacteraceae bacterium A2-2]